MSTARLVPETYELSGDDAWHTLRDTGRFCLLKDAFVRLRYSDGFSHARSLAFMQSLVLVQGTIAVVGLASALGTNRVSHGIITAAHSLVPGPAGRLVTTAVRQARHAGAGGRYVALAFGVVGSLVSGTTAMGQLERGLNRLYGVEQDRPALQKYGRAFVLAVTVGLLLTVCFLAVGFGGAIGRSFGHGAAATLWNWVRWPVAVALMSAAVALLFRWCPNRRQPSWSWLVFGSSVSVVIWFAVTLGMGLVFSASHSFGQTYGPLAGIMALQLWCLLSSVGVLFGGAVAAQLEAVRAGRATPRDPAKAEAESGPDHGGAPVSTPPADRRDRDRVPVG